MLLFLNYNRIQIIIITQIIIIITILSLYIIYVNK